MRVHLIDGTYELFRHFYAMPSQTNAAGEEIAAARGVVVSMMNLLRDGATHVAVATDQIIESFRNDLWPGYKTGAGIDPALWSQFPIVEEALAAMGLVVWAMVEFEADDALVRRRPSRGRRCARVRSPHLHSRQGPRAVRRGRAHRAARPAARHPQR